ncbi:MAG: exo-alpha-sialidase [Clostridia bacterium]|nr:exo-alpha-sialidase [Clostridia bacterium]
MSVKLTHTIGRNETYTRNSEGAFLRLNDGGILFVYSRFTGANGYDDAACDLVCEVSRDEGESWSEARVLMEAGTWGVKNIMSVSLLRMLNGDLGLIYLIKQNDRSSTVMLSRSRDEGVTFYRHTPCTLSDRPAYFVINNDRAERLKSGRIVLPLAYHRRGLVQNGYTDWRSIEMFLLSDDDGETWREAADIVYPPFTRAGAGLQEPGVIELRDDLLMSYARTDKLCQYVSYSFDSGEHWTNAEPSAFSSPCSPMKIARNPANGDLYAVWNPIPNYAGRRIYDGCGGRTPIVYAVSRDNAQSWSAPTVIEGREDHGYCYPALFFTRDNSLLVSYCAGGPEDGHCLTRTNISKIGL